MTTQPRLVHLTPRPDGGESGDRPAHRLPRRSRGAYVQEAQEAEALRRGELVVCRVPDLGQARNKTQRLRKRLGGAAKLESRYQGGLLYLQTRPKGDQTSRQAGETGVSSSA